MKQFGSAIGNWWEEMEGEKTYELRVGPGLGTDLLRNDGSCVKKKGRPPR